MPSPVGPTVGTNGIPSIFPSIVWLNESPRFIISSLMVSAITTVCPISISWVVRYKLRSRLDNIDNDIGTLIEQVVAHEELFRSVCGNRIGARQVRYEERAPIVVEAGLLCAYGNAAVVPDMLA